MKNNDLQELRPIYIHEASYSAEDEISLIDLAIVLINRKKLISLIFISFIVLGIAVALLTPKKYTYSTSVEIGSRIINGSVKPFESPQTLLAKLQYNFIPQTLNEHQLSNPGDKKTFKIKASIPKSSNIIALEVTDTEEQADLIKSLLLSTTQKAVLDHSRNFESAKKHLLSQLEQANTKLTNLGSNKPVAKTNLQSKIKRYSSQLASLRNTREISPPMKSLGASGTSRKQIVIIAAFVGLFIAIFTAFFAEFVVKVKEQVKARNS